MVTLKYSVFSYSICCILTGVLLLFYGCSENKDVIVMKQASLQAFHTIELNDAFDINLTQDSNFSIQIEATNRFIHDISFQVEDSVLRIDYLNSSRWKHPKTNKVTLTIHANRPKLILANESCYIRTTNPIISDEFGYIAKGKLNQADFELGGRVFYTWNVHPCGGKVWIRGKTDELKIWNFAIMAVDASACETRYALVENVSKGNCNVFVSEKLDYSLLGEGNIYLKGNPALQLISQSGTGQLITYP